MQNRDIHFLQYIFEELLEQLPTPFTLRMDNKAAEIFILNTAKNSRLKHIDRRQYWVKQMHDQGLFLPQWVPTKANVADLFTKGVTGTLCTLFLRSITSLQR